MEPLILSASALQSFSRCPKSFELSYHRGLETRSSNQYVEWGSSFHKIMEMSVKQGSLIAPDDAEDPGDVWLCAKAYLEAYPPYGQTIMCEDPLYTELLPDVYLRTTFDRVYIDGTRVVAVDYKTFSRAPTYDVDLDFQGRIYLAALARKFPANRVSLEYHNVRSVAPGSPRGTKGKEVWDPADCYEVVSLFAGEDELEQLWKEAQWTAQEILARMADDKWRRVGLKGAGPYTCHGCFQRPLCVTELANGALATSDIALYADRKPPLTMENKPLPVYPPWSGE